MRFPYPASPPRPAFLDDRRRRASSPSSRSGFCTRAMISMDGCWTRRPATPFFPCCGRSELGIDLSAPRSGNPCRPAVSPSPTDTPRFGCTFRTGGKPASGTASWGSSMSWQGAGHPGARRVSEFLDSFLYGARREVEILPNVAFTGLHTVH